MNPPVQPPTLVNTPGSLTKFQQLLQEKSTNFVGRKFVFTTIHEFLQKYDRGYFTLIGAPGSGKSAILAKYVTSNPHVIYYSAQVEGKNRADQFLLDICTQLINYYPDVGAEYIVSLPDNATEGSWFLSLLLQKISDSLEPDQPLIIAIDALDAIAPDSQPASSNLLYLPRYLPAKVYFLLTRRPFVRERSRLLIEAPSQVLTLEDYPEQNRADVQAYIQQYLTPLHLTEQEFSEQLTAQSENNFMYLSQILAAIAEGFYSELFQFDRIPPGLEAYYQNHWHRMNGNDLSPIELAVLRSLVTLQPPFDKQGISAELIAQMIDEDDYEVEVVLQNWIEFLRSALTLVRQSHSEERASDSLMLRKRSSASLSQPIDGKIHYRFYHSSFCNWLGNQLKLD
ncbi:MAG TPA: ATP-binding protein [Coleofasciculaceae cyanobacterium]